MCSVRAARKIPLCQSLRHLGICECGVWIFFAYLMRPYASIPRDPLQYFMLCFFLCLLGQTWCLGQNSLILLVLYTLTFICLKRRQDYLAGVFLGLGLLKYHLVLPFALICLLRGKWRMMAGFALTGSALGALSFATVGSAGVLSYGHLLVDIARNPESPVYWSFNARNIMPTIRGGRRRAVGQGVSSGWINALAALASAGLVLFTARRWRREDRYDDGDSLSLMFAAALAVSLLVAPHLYWYDLALMLIPLLLVFNSSRWLNDATWRRG